jgi:hypothetical protein
MVRSLDAYLFCREPVEVVDSDLCSGDVDSGQIERLATEVALTLRGAAD